MKRDPLDIVARGDALEQQFTAPLTQAQRQQLDRYFDERSPREAMVRACGPAVLELAEALENAGVRPQAMFAVSMVPLLEVCWADGQVQAGERDAMEKALVQHGFAADEIQFTAVVLWLDNPPPPHLFQTWVRYIAALDEQLFAGERKQLMALLVDQARTIARAAGGLLGIRSISEREERVIEKLQDAFSYPEQFADMWTWDRSESDSE